MTLRQLVRFWGTLTIGWLFMTVEFAVVNALIARLPLPKFNLAAFGVTLSLVMMCESPVFANISAANALVRDSNTYRLMLRFSCLLGGAMSLLLALLSFGPIFNTLTYSILDLEPGVASLVHPSLMCMFITPFAVGLRRFYQGILLSFGKVKYVAYGTAVRLSSVVICGLCLSNAHIDGAIVGSLAFMSGMVMDALFSRFAVRGCIAELLKREKESDLTMRSITNFYMPLAVTSVILISVHPMTSFFLAHSRFALESLAVFPVVQALILIFKSGAFALQELTISALNQSLGNDALLRRLARIVSLLLTLVLLLAAYSGIAHAWFEQVGGLSHALLPFTDTPFALMAFLPGVVVWSAYLRGYMISMRRTRAISASGIIEVVFMFTSLFVLIYATELDGATAASLALLIGSISAIAWLVTVRLKEL